MGRIIIIAGGKIQTRGVKKATAGQRIDSRYKDSADEWIAGGKWIKVKSSNVAAIKYDKPAQRLYVRFKDNSVYYYPSQGTKDARAMYNAPSMGKQVWKMRRAGVVGVKV